VPPVWQYVRVQNTVLTTIDIPFEVPTTAKLSVQCRRSRHTGRYRFTINARWINNGRGYDVPVSCDFGSWFPQDQMAGTESWEAAKASARQAMMIARAQLAGLR
jgi:hypothetical protein